MVYNNQKPLTRPLSLDSRTLERTREFDYLGVRLSALDAWVAQIEKSAATIKHRAGARIRFARRASSYPIPPGIEIYNMQDRSAALFGDSFGDIKIYKNWDLLKMIS